MKRKRGGRQTKRNANISPEDVRQNSELRRVAMKTSGSSYLPGSYCGNIILECTAQKTAKPKGSSFPRMLSLFEYL